MPAPPSPETPVDRRGPFLARSFLPLALITVGVFFLLGNLVPERGRAGLMLLGLGTAFLIGRLTTARYGYAVPAGLLIALSAYISLPVLWSAEPVRSRAGWFFVLLGLGFALVYVIGLRPGAVWPLFPAAVLLGLGLVLFGLSAVAPLAALSWIAAYWPAVLVILGVWLLLRDHLPLAVRRPLGTLGGLVLLGYGVLAAASSVAAGGALAQTGLAPSFGASPFADTLTLDAQIGPNQTLSVANTSGRTTVRASAEVSLVHVVATRHFGVAGHPPDVQLTPTGDGLSLAASNPSDTPLDGPSWVDYTIDLPAGAGVSVQAGSGQVDVDGINGRIAATTGSGAISVSNTLGAVDARTSSGGVSLSNLAGDVRVHTSSGRVQGTELRHARDVQTSSGAVSLTGVFGDAGQIVTSSGSVDVRLLPGSAVVLRVQTGSGSIDAHELALAQLAQERNALSGTLGAPAADAVLRIETTSGHVSLGT